MGLDEEGVRRHMVADGVSTLLGSFEIGGTFAA
jgi:hypothetical protein